MRPRLVASLLFALALPAAAFELRHDSEGDLVKWAPTVEFVIDAQLGVQLGEPKADRAVKAAVEALDQGTPDFDVRVKVGTHLAVGYVAGELNQNDVFALDDWPYDAQALAATVITVNVRTNQIIDADVVFNAQDHRFQVLDQRPNGDAEQDLDDVQNTVTHELGHALGLMHNQVDEAVVMYPSAPPLETSKRVLAPDDLAGLAALYASGSGVQPVIDPTTLGCAAASSTPGGLVLLVGAWLLLGLRARRPRPSLVPVPRRARAARRAAPFLLALLPTLGLTAEPVERQAPDLAAADRVAVAEVTARSSLTLPGRPGLLFTDVQLTVREAVKGGGERTVVVRLPGGRVGDLEQVVAHQPVPALHEAVVLVQTRARARVLRLEDPVQQTLLRKAFGRARLPVPVSLEPQGASQPLPLRPQHPVIVP